MKTSVTYRDLAIIVKALWLYAGRPSEERAENVNCSEIVGLAEHIDVIRRASMIDTEPTAIEVKKL